MTVPNHLGILAPWLFCIAAAAHAQTASITGTVRARAHPVPNALVLLEDQQNRQQFTTETAADGHYAFTALTPGFYVLRVTLPGFAPFTRAWISADPAEPVDLNIDLQPLTHPREVPIGVPPPPVAPQAGPALRLTGRGMLVGEEPEAPGYGLYSYVLFASGPTDATRERFASAFRACLQMITAVRNLEAAGVPRDRLNITYLPVKQPPPPHRPDADWVMHNYNWARSQVLLSRVPRRLSGPGPYIVSTLQPISAWPSEHYLLQDLSAVPADLMPAWFQEFLSQAEQGRFWAAPTVSDMALRLRTNIQIAALALPNVKGAAESWKSLLANWITDK